MLEYVARRLAQESGVFGFRDRETQLGKFSEKSVMMDGLSVDNDAVHVEDDRANHAGKAGEWVSAKVPAAGGHNTVKRENESDKTFLSKMMYQH
jgi:hypothetical protein